MPYVQRDASGNINGAHGELQPGIAEEFLPDDDPEVVAFLEAVNAPPPPSEGQAIAFDHENRLRALEGQPPLSQEDFAQKAQR